MIFDEVGSGGVKIRGCAAVDNFHLYISTYNVGDVVYDAFNAKQGVLTKICVKQVVVVNPSLTGGIFVAMYKDTFNALYNEWDLVTLSEAQILIQNYETDRQIELENLDNKCS